jgi:hypothetical protein
MMSSTLIPNRHRPLAARRTVALLLAAAVLVGCSSMSAQNPAGSWRPVNATPDAQGQALLLKGADVVAYFTQGRYVQGQPQFRSRHEGVTCSSPVPNTRRCSMPHRRSTCRSTAAIAPTASPTASPGGATPTPGAWSTASSTSSAAWAARKRSNSTWPAT